MERQKEDKKTPRDDIKTQKEVAKRRKATGLAPVGSADGRGGVGKRSEEFIEDVGGKLRAPA